MVNKKVLILTFQFADNYGALLQAYALKKVLEDMGCIADVANYVSEYNKAEYSRNPFVVQGSLLKKIKRVVKLPLAWKQMKLCEEFRKNYLMLKCEIGKDELDALSKKYDVLVVGSDQVWNGKCTNNNSTYFLDFGKNAKKVSYAASLGTQILTDFQKKCIAKYVPGFNAVSIREKDNLQEIKEIIPNAISTVDPVLLYKDYWNDFVARAVVKPLRKKYILYYSLGGEKNFENIAKSLENQYSLPVIGVHPTAKKYHANIRQLYNVGPVEFLALLKNAELVCSDSFHATCFSIIFDKILCYKTNEDNPGRAESMLRQFGVNPIDAFYGEDIYQVIDCSKINKSVLEEEILKSRSFLNAVI